MVLGEVAEGTCCIGLHLWCGRYEHRNKRLNGTSFRDGVLVLAVIFGHLLDGLRCQCAQLHGGHLFQGRARKAQQDAD